MTIAERQELKTGTSLSLDGRKCMILGVMGAGTSCIAYKAQMELIIEGKTTSRTIVLKELYPSHQNIIREKDNSLIIPANFQTAFEEESKSFVEAAILQFEFHNEEELTNFTSDIEIVYKLNNTLYSVTGIVSGKSYDKINPENITSILKVGESLSYAISYYHRKNYLNLDIKPSNIFYENLLGDNVTIKLFDFNTVCTKEEALQGKFSYSEGYAAPEVKAAKKGGGNFSDVGEQADIYSIGAVIFEKIIGRIPKVADQRKGKKWKLETNPYLKEVAPQLQNGITELFRKTLAIDNKDRYSSVKELIKDLDKLIELASIKVFLKSQNISPCTAKNIYIPRKNVCNSIYKKLNLYHILYLYTIRGNGKSETAREYAETYADKYDFIQSIFYSQNLKKTIANLDFVGLKQEDKIAHTDEDINRLYSYKLDLLGNTDIYTSNTLLIIDNYDYDSNSESEEYKQNVKVLADLRKLHIHIIFTTRINPTDTAHCFKLPDMSQQELEELFFKINPTQKDDLDQKRLVDEIIEVSYNHTMTVKLVALQSKKYKKSLGEYLSVLKKNGLNSHIQGRITNEKDDESVTMSAVYDHIKALFDFDDLSSKEKYIMVNACLLPLEGLDTVTFSNFIGLNNFDVSSSECIDESIENLVNRGWITYTNSDETQISIHNLIFDVVINELKPELTEDKCKKFYISFLHLISEWGNSKINKMPNCQLKRSRIYLIFSKIIKVFFIHSYTSCMVIDYIDTHNKDFFIENYMLINDSKLLYYFGIEEICEIPNNISSINDFAFFSCNLIKKVVIPDSVKKIGDAVFQECKSITEVILPNTIDEIGFGTFANCKSLNNVNLPKSIKFIRHGAFSGCTSLKTINLPNGIKSISMWNFADCTSLAYIKIPNSVIMIDGWAFANCKSLKKIEIPNNVSLVERFAFENCSSLSEVIVKNKFTIINNTAFKGCKFFNPQDQSFYSMIKFPKSKRIPFIHLLFDYVNDLIEIFFVKIVKYHYVDIEDIRIVFIFDEVVLTEILDKNKEKIIIPKIVNRIGDCSFENCCLLTQVTIPNNVKELGVGAFSDCTALTQVKLSNKITEIPWSTFENCTSLTQVTIPPSVRKIGMSAFENCTSLSQITIPSSVKEIGMSAFENCTSLTQVTIPPSVKKIGMSAFENCTSLTQVTIPNKIKKIEDNVFSGCTKLKQLLIPHNVLEIGEESFADCKLLTEVNIPQNIKKVGRCAFDYPTLLKIKLSNKNIDISESRIGYYGDENGLYRKNNNLTIEGYKGSTAQEYAKEHGFNFESID